MIKNDPKAIFTQETLNRLFPADRTDAFFDALFGDASEGAYDISLCYDRVDESRNELYFSLCLTGRPGKCLVCNLTYGLPEVFSRHPVINIKGLVNEIATLMGATNADWKLESTTMGSKKHHEIPLVVKLQG